MSGSCTLKTKQNGRELPEPVTVSRDPETGSYGIVLDKQEECRIREDPVNYRI